MDSESVDNIPCPRCGLRIGYWFSVPGEDRDADDTYPGTLMVSRDRFHFRKNMADVLVPPLGASCVKCGFEVPFPARGLKVWNNPERCVKAAFRAALGQVFVRAGMQDLALEGA